MSGWWVFPFALRVRHLISGKCFISHDVYKKFLAAAISLIEKDGESQFIIEVEGLNSFNAKPFFFLLLDKRGGALRPERTANPPSAAARAEDHIIVNAALSLNNIQSFDFKPTTENALL